MRRQLSRAGIPPEHLAALSHEFRTPLSGVLGMARLLQGTRLTAEQRDYVSALVESGEHLLGLVNDVLDYAKLGAGRVELHRSPLQVEDVLRSVCELLSPRAQEKGIEIGWAADSGLAPVLADEGKLKQILLNLAGNAVKFTADGGVLLLAEAAGKNALRFTVSDTGPGVPKALRAGIFEAFAQAEPAPQARAEGAGLGLAIASRLAEAMGGHVGVGGDVGAGADFWFEAPFLAAGAAQRRRPLRGRTVAIVSPSAIVREAAARQVEASGGRAVRAAGVDEALAQTAAKDVILIDHALAKPRRKLVAPQGRAAVILVKPGERAKLAAYRKAGFVGYLIKPLRRASLTARVLAAEGAAGAAPPVEDERIDRRETAAAPAGLRVLLAEDNPINALLARTLLTREGCAVDHVADGEGALEALATAGYDLVLMDVRMPVIGGMAASRAARQRGVTTPIVALTANAFEDDRRACLAAGMDDFLVKPLAPAALKAALARWTGPGWTRDGARARLAR